MSFMGWTRKKRRQSEQEMADEANRTTKKEVDGWFKRVLDRGSEWADEKHRQVVNQAVYDRRFDFMEICGVGEYEAIDWENPHVKILKLACDPVNMRLFANPKLRSKVYDKMDPET